MSTEGAEQNPIRALSTFGRVVWREALSVVVLSVLFGLASLSIITIGPAAVAMVDTFYSSVTFTGTGAGVPPRTADRANHFVASIWTYLRPGLLYTPLCIAAGLGLYGYYRLVQFGEGATSLVVGIVGFYVTALALVVMFRGANVLVHAPADDRPGTIRSLRQAWSSLTDLPGYAAVHLVIAASIAFLCRTFPVLLVVLFTGLLALLEVVMYEELSGVGARAIRFAYEDPQE